MKKEFNIYTKGLRVAIYGDRMTAHRDFGDIILWQGGEIVAMFPKHSIAMYMITHKDDVIIKAYKLII